MNARVLLVSLAVVFSFFSTSLVANAQTATAIKAQIDAHNTQIKALEDEISRYQKELNTLGTQKNTLQSAVNSLVLSQKQLGSKIKVTQANIAWANKQIKELSVSIGDKETSIQSGQAAIGKALRSINQDDGVSLLAQLVSENTLSDAWQRAEEAAQFNRALGENIADLRSARVVLTDNRDQVTAEKQKLLRLESDLLVQNKSLDVSKAAQQKLLADTKNQESGYQALIAQKRAQQAQFEKQLYQFEQELKTALDPTSIPTAGKGILAWPLSNPRITQYFGKTIDAKVLYVSGTHGGVDFGASIGTPIKAARSGTVTDIEGVKYKNGCQYGKWVLVNHGNGLSTIYGHLSHVYVKPGGVVTTGQTIGLSGDTGYATGPHLHFGVYATAGVRVVDASQLGSVNCAGIKTVAASPNAYLNPMAYF